MLETRPTESGNGGLTLTVLGCGVMGTAILSGVMAALNDSPRPSSANGRVPARLPTKFIACDTWHGAHDSIHAALDKYKQPLEVYINNNVGGASAADIVLLACKPHLVNEVLGAPGMHEALHGKLLMSILAGVSAEQIHAALYPHSISSQGACRIVRVMPNTAALVRQSMTVIAQPTSPLSDDQMAIVMWIFNRCGRVVQMPAQLMDASTALCGSGPAFVALVLEGLADGAVAMGIPRKEAQLMAAQVTKGTTGLVLEENRHPSILKDMVSTPGGCTIRGLLTLEDGAVRGHVARAIGEATAVASRLGQSSRNGNGNRH